jgi:hypothetical protein
MGSLVDKLAKEPIRPLVIADCVDLIEAQVKQKGFVIKSAYATIKAIKKRFVSETVDALLDDWLTKLEPHHEAWSVNKTGTLSAYLVGKSDTVAEDLLSVTDARAERTSHTTARKMYGRMRDGAKRNVIEAIPALGQLLEKHLAASPQQPAATV